MQDFVEPHGDRRQEIVFIGQDLNDSAISRVLDDCLCLERDLRQVSHGSCCWLKSIQLIASSAQNHHSPGMCDCIGDAVYLPCDVSPACNWSVS